MIHLGKDTDGVEGILSAYASDISFDSLGSLAFSVGATLSKKTNLTKLDPQKALDTINNTDIYDYQYRRDGNNGRHYASLVIDDVHDDPEYDTPSEFLGEDHHYRDDGTQLAYLTAAVQLIDQRLKKLEDKQWMRTN